MSRISVIEIAVTEAHVKHGWPTEKKHLADLVRKVLVELVDPSPKAKTYQAATAAQTRPSAERVMGLVDNLFMRNLAGTTDVRAVP